MGKYRNRIDIIAAVLDVAAKGACKTRIMYIANLSYKLLEKYLRETLELGFIGSSNGGYQVTDKGLAFLERYSSFLNKYSAVETERQRMLFEKEALEKLCQPARNFRYNSNSRRKRSR